MFSTRTAEPWRLSAILLVQPLKTAAAAFAHLMRRLRPARDGPGVSHLSDEWLRGHEIESFKHRDEC